ncbi:hypothetical protein OROGR_010153 [Orobanche gracilis]
MLIQAFISPWKLQDIVGKPSSSGFWRDNSLSKFAVSHRLSRRDSIASLAVKYTVQFLEMVWDKKVGDVLQLSVVRASQNDPIHVNMVVDEVAVEKFNLGHGTSEAVEVRAAAVLFMLTFVEYYLSSPNSG